MIESFEERLNFDLDSFQKQAIEKINKNCNVLVCAPTGSGKTVIAHFAVYKSLCDGKKAFYTTPIKALSNQKYRELEKEYGSEKVGLLTGDIAINPQAQILVMTTEVLRNMIYEKSERLENLNYVILDEIHYLADEFRGPIWEEIIIHLDTKIPILGLSATISNSLQFSNWIKQCRYECELIQSSYRPVPLYNKMLIGNKIYDLFEYRKINNKEQKQKQDLKEKNTLCNNNVENFSINKPIINKQVVKAVQKVPADHSVKYFKTKTLNRPEIISLLNKEKMLPAIFFIFSRATCDQALKSCFDKKIDLTTDNEKIQIQQRFDIFYKNISKEDRKSLNLHKWAKCLIYGYATHHAGMLPVMKEFVEKLFADGLIKVVFATGTLALGVNMPAKTVFLETLKTWNGKAHVMLNPIEFTQLAGRAGRRGIDTEGNVILLYDGSIDPEDYFDIATSNSYDLNSVFKPTYNMVANLLKNYDIKNVEKLLRSSFAQFQGNESIVKYAKKIEKEEETKNKYLENVKCSKGDFLEYAKLKSEYKIQDSKYRYEKFLKQKQNAELFLDQYCKVGAIFTYKKGRHRKYGIAITKPIGRNNIFFTVITEKGNKKKIYADSLDANMCGFVMQIDKSKLQYEQRALFYEAFYNNKSAKKLSIFLNKIIRKNVNTKIIYPNKARMQGMKILSDLETKIYEHSCNSCKNKKQHLENYNKYIEHEKNIKQYEKIIDSQAGNISKTLFSIIYILQELEYLDKKTKLTEKGMLLSNIHSDNDILIAEIITNGILDTVEHNILAPIMSSFIYSGRKNAFKKLPKNLERNYGELSDIFIKVYKKVYKLEKKYNVQQINELDFGLTQPLHDWCMGRELSNILQNSEMQAGDFVRWAKQVKDLLIQIENVSNTTVSIQALLARKKINRGVIAWSSM